MFGGLPLAPSVRLALRRRCSDACEGCGLEWPWALYIFRVAEDGRSSAANLVVLCGACSVGRAGASAPFIGVRTTREQMLTANNRRAGVERLTAARRRALIKDRGGACEVCGASGEQRALQVHHRLAVLQGGDDGEANLQVLCFACHHRVQPCSNGCGHWAKKPRTICRHCLARMRLLELMPGTSREEIHARYSL